MSAVDDFLKNVLGLSNDDIKALQAIGSVISLIAGIVGYIAVAKSVLESLGILPQTDEIQQAVDQIVQQFEGMLAADDRAQQMRAVAENIEKARTQLQHLIDDAPENPSGPGSPTWESLRGGVLDQSQEVVNILGNKAYWLRPFFPEGVFHNYFVESTGGTLTPALDSESGLVFDYRLTLPAYMEAIAIRLVISAAMVPDFKNVHNDELNQIATRLGGYFEAIRSGIVEFRPPSFDELLNPARREPPNGITTDWDSQFNDPYERPFGAVELYSTFHVIDNWPLNEFPPPDAPNLGLSWDDPREPITAQYLAAYPKFLVRHLVRTLARWKHVYNQIGLPFVAAALTQITALAVGSPVALTGPTGDWSVRELAQRLAGIPNSGFTTGHGPTISVGEMLPFLQTFNPTPYTSLRVALAQ